MSTNDSSDKLHLAYATDKGYLLLATVSALSAISQASDPTRLVFHLLDCGLDEADWDRFHTALTQGGKGATVLRHRVGMEQFEGFTRWRGSMGAYARLLLPEVLPDKSWCVYVDCDTLFVDDPLGLCACVDPEAALQGYPIWQGNFSEQWVVDEVCAWFRENRGKDIEGGTLYLNSGFIVINLDWWRKHEVKEACMDFLRQCPSAHWPDEMALNDACFGHTKALPTGWGTFAGYALRAPTLHCIHFIGCAPHKTRFNRMWGFNDVTAAWMVCARTLLGLSVTEASGVPRWKWTLGRLYNRLLRPVVTFGAHLPGLKESKRVFLLRGTFVIWHKRWLLSPRLWTERWHGQD